MTTSTGHCSQSQLSLRFQDNTQHTTPLAENKEEGVRKLRRLSREAFEYLSTNGESPPLLESHRLDSYGIEVPDCLSLNPLFSLNKQQEVDLDQDIQDIKEMSFEDAISLIPDRLSLWFKLNQRSLLSDISEIHVQLENGILGIEAFIDLWHDPEVGFNLDEDRDQFKDTLPILQLVAQRAPNKLSNLFLVDSDVEQETPCKNILEDDHLFSEALPLIEEIAKLQPKIFVTLMSMFDIDGNPIIACEQRLKSLNTCLETLSKEHPDFMKQLAIIPDIELKLSLTTPEVFKIIVPHLVEMAKSHPIKLNELLMQEIDVWNVSFLECIEVPSDLASLLTCLAEHHQRHWYELQDFISNQHQMPIIFVEGFSDMALPILVSFAEKHPYFFEEILIKFIYGWPLPYFEPWIPALSKLAEINPNHMISILHRRTIDGFHLVDFQEYHTFFTPSLKVLAEHHPKFLFDFFITKDGHNLSKIEYGDLIERYLDVLEVLARHHPEFFVNLCFYPVRNELGNDIFLIMRPDFIKGIQAILKQLAEQSPSEYDRLISTPLNGTAVIFSLFNDFLSSFTIFADNYPERAVALMLEETVEGYCFSDFTEALLKLVPTLLKMGKKHPQHLVTFLSTRNNLGKSRLGNSPNLILSTQFLDTLAERDTRDVEFLLSSQVLDKDKSQLLDNEHLTPFYMQYGEKYPTSLATIFSEQYINGNTLLHRPSFFERMLPLLLQLPIDLTKVVDRFGLSPVDYHRRISLNWLTRPIPELLRTFTLEEDNHRRVAKCRDILSNRWGEFRFISEGGTIPDVYAEYEGKRYTSIEIFAGIQRLLNKIEKLECWGGLPSSIEALNAYYSVILSNVEFILEMLSRIPSKKETIGHVCSLAFHEITTTCTQALQDELFAMVCVLAKICDVDQIVRRAIDHALMIDIQKAMKIATANHPTELSTFDYCGAIQLKQSSKSYMEAETRNQLFRSFNLKAFIKALSKFVSFDMASEYLKQKTPDDFDFAILNTAGQSVNILEEITRLGDEEKKLKHTTRTQLVEILSGIKREYDTRPVEMVAERLLELFDSLRGVPLKPMIQLEKLENLSIKHEALKIASARMKELYNFDIPFEEYQTKDQDPAVKEKWNTMLANCRSLLPQPTLEDIHDFHSRTDYYWEFIKSAEQFDSGLFNQGIADPALALKLLNQYILYRHAMDKIGEGVSEAFELSYTYERYGCPSVALEATRRRKCNESWLESHGKALMKILELHGTFTA